MLVISTQFTLVVVPDLGARPAFVAYDGALDSCYTPLTTCRHTPRTVHIPEVLCQGQTVGIPEHLPPLVVSEVLAVSLRLVESCAQPGEHVSRGEVHGDFILVAARIDGCDHQRSLADSKCTPQGD